MAVSALSLARNRSTPAKAVQRMLGFSMRWALGHGTVLVSVAALLVFTKFELPSQVSQLAEKSIGIMLVGLGLWIIRDMVFHRLKLELHTHNGVAHVHLTQSGKKHHNHQPVLVGAVHGLAGSAPVLALIPVAGMESVWFGLGYAVLFSSGVLLSMLAFGLFFGRLQNWIAGFGQRIFQINRGAMALISISFGAYWLI
jgi:sulfite exporter TauE/SafE